MDADDSKPEQPDDKETISERLKRLKREEGEEETEKFDENGNLNIKLTKNDSALVVRDDGTLEMVSHELEEHEDGFIGDIEDLNKTFALVLALASSLENEDLYNRIFHNLHMSLMSKWNILDDNIKEEIVQRRRNAQINRSEEERKEKKERIDDFRKRMNKYKDQFLNEAEEEKKRLQKDLEDEAEFHKKYGSQFAETPEEPEDIEASPEDMFDKMESRPRKKIKKKKPLQLPARGTDWNPYDETLIQKKGKWRLDYPPKEEEE